MDAEGSDVQYLIGELNLCASLVLITLHLFVLIRASCSYVEFYKGLWHRFDDLRL